MIPGFTRWLSGLSSAHKTLMVEVLLTAFALLFLLWQAQSFRSEDFLKAGGNRYQADLVRVASLPPTASQLPLAAACALPRESLARVELGHQDAKNWLCSTLPKPMATALDTCKPEDWREDLCWGVTPEYGEQAGALITNLSQAVQESLLAPLRQEERRQKEELRTNRAGLPVTQPTTEEAEDTDDDTTDEIAEDRAYGEYRREYLLERINIEGTQRIVSRPVFCAMTWLTENIGILGDADAHLLSAAILAGRYAQVTNWQIQDGRKLPAFSASLSLVCSDLGSPGQVASQSAHLMKKAYASDDMGRKGAAASILLRRAGEILLVYTLLAYALIEIGRRPLSLPGYIAFGLMTWGLAGWWSGVQLPGVASILWQRWLFPSVAVVSGLLWLLLRLMPLEPFGPKMRTPRQRAGSRGGYAGFVLLVGLGWWLLLDLSAHGDLRNRFLALNQHAFVFAAFVLVSLLPALRLGMARFIGRVYAVLLTTQSPGMFEGWRRWLPWCIPPLFVLLPLMTVFQHHRPLTSELLRLWFILGVSWFLFVRGELIVRATLKASHKSLLLPLLWPLLMITALLIAGHVVTDDQGPLLVTLFGSAILAGGLVTLLLEEAGQRKVRSLMAGMLATILWIGAIGLALFVLGDLHSTTKQRLESWRNPFSASNETMAIIHDFRSSIPPGGYGLGQTPWCGEHPEGRCSGMPLQVQSDYTFTALQGVLGLFWAAVMMLIMLFWLSRLLSYHGRASSGRPDFSSDHASSQAWISWMVLCWVGLMMAQVVVTVAGNLGWLPLSGVTLPFVSYGAWSLLANSFFLALSLNVLPPEKSS